MIGFHVTLLNILIKKFNLNQIYKKYLYFLIYFFADLIKIFQVLDLLIVAQEKL